MTTITVALSEDRLKQLNDLAALYRIAPEELVRISVDDLLARPDEEFRKVLEYVLTKNAELYRRLA